MDESGSFKPQVNQVNQRIDTQSSTCYTDRAFTKTKKDKTMNKDFILINGHGIFPTSTIVQIVPVNDVSFDLQVLPPIEPGSAFVFNLIKEVSVNLDIARTNPTKKNEVEVMTDYSYNRVISESYEFTQDELIKMLDLGDDETITGHIKDYNRRLKKMFDYQAALNAIQSNPDLPDYESSLSAIKHNAPSSSTERKQDKTLNKLQSALYEKVLELVEAADEDNESALITIINSDESHDAIEDAATKVLAAFYNKNFEEAYASVLEDIEDETEDSSSFAESYGLDKDEETEDERNARIASQLEIQREMREQAATALNNAEVIKSSPDTITNS